MLTRASFSSFKALRDVALPLGSITALIGPNASGKSSVLDGIYLASQLARPRRKIRNDLMHPVAAVFKGLNTPERLRTVGSRDPLGIALETSDGILRVNWTPDEEGEWLATVSYPSDAKSLVLPNEARSASAFFEDLPASLSAVVRLRMDPSKLKRPSYSNDEIPLLEHDGAGLASAIAHIAATSSGGREAIEADLRGIVPGIGRIRAPRAEVKQIETIVLPDGNTTQSERVVWGNRVEIEMPGTGYLPADLLSEGTLLSLAIITLLNSTVMPRVILLDDIETGLHPRAQQALVAVLRRFLKRSPNVQFVITTHSPYLLDALEDDEVHALRLDESGHTHCRKLSSHPDWTIWRDKMKMGEFWSTVGEDWVAPKQER